MKTPRQFLSLERQERIRPIETAERALIGFAEDYPAGLKTGMHSHPRGQLLYAVSGIMRIATEGANYVVPPSAALLLPADKPHDIEMDGPVKMRALFLRKSAAAKIGERTAVYAVTPLLRELIVAACAEPWDWDLDGRGHHIAALALDEIEASTVLPMAVVKPVDPRLRRVTEALAQTPTDDRSLEDWADIVGATSRTLMRLFRSETGMSFRQWRRHLRLTEAFTALVTGASPTQAAAVAGFSSVPAFGAAFLEVFGLTPGQARARFSQTNASTGTAFAVSSDN